MKRTFFYFIIFHRRYFHSQRLCRENGNDPDIPGCSCRTHVIIDTPTSTVSCSSIIAEPTLAPSADSYFPPVSQADFSFGPADAPVTIVEYCDFQSEGCRNMASIIGELMRNHDDVRFVFRPLPLIGILDKSDKAVLAALAADEQGKFWEMYDLLFVKYDEWVESKTRGVQCLGCEGSCRGGD